MPSHLAHLAYAQQLYPRFLPGEAAGAVLLGTLLPDIRYPAKLHRAATHPAVVGKVQLWHSEGFRQGFLLHGAVDLAWEHMLRESPEILTGLEKSVYNTALKLAIDFLSWPTVSEEFIEACGEDLPYEEMERMGVSKRSADRWYRLMAWYVSQAPTLERQARLGRAFGMSEAKVQAVVNATEQFLADPQTERIAGDFADSLPERLGLKNVSGE